MGGKGGTMMPLSTVGGRGGTEDLPYTVTLSDFTRNIDPNVPIQVTFKLMSANGEEIQYANIPSAFEFYNWCHDNKYVLKSSTGVVGTLRRTG
jgi:hypothetical protein